jgi:DnaD/phage-associated family protein
MAWIESHQELARHPKTKKFARLLGVSLPSAVGHLHFFWWWAMDYAQDGDLSRYDQEEIADACGWEGEPQKILRALSESGFVDETETSILIHDWHEYAGRLIEKREQNKERKRKSRARHADVTRPSQEIIRDDRESHRATKPNQTIPNQTINNTAATTSAPAPNESQPESFPAAYKRVYQRDLTSFQAEQLGAYIDDEGFEESVIIRAIERSANKEGGLSLVFKILNDYAAAGAKTLEGAKAFDDQFEANKQRRTHNRGDPSRYGSRKPSMTLVTSEPSGDQPTPEQIAEMRKLVHKLKGRDGGVEVDAR